jgi:hypothetical protein
MAHPRMHAAVLILLLAALLPVLSCAESTPRPAAVSPSAPGRTPRFALWLADMDELTGHPGAAYDLVMTAWFEPGEAAAIRARRPSARLLAGLTSHWILEDPGWLEFLLTVANGGDASGPLQIADDMFLTFDEDGDGRADRRCSPPGWEEIYAMDPRSSRWRELILSFYRTVAEQEQHDGVIVDMVDAYPFCDGARSGDVPNPISADAWVEAQDELLDLIRARVPEGKWIIANAGHDFPAGSPFARHVNGYVLENFLGDWGAGLAEGLASAQRALESTRPPHLVVFAVDTDDTGTADERRFRTGLAASLLMDNTYFAFDSGPRDHGGVADWWRLVYDQIILGMPDGPYDFHDGMYRREFEHGTVVLAVGEGVRISLSASHIDILSGDTGTVFDVPPGDARILVRI